MVRGHRSLRSTLRTDGRSFGERQVSPSGAQTAFQMMTALEERGLASVLLFFGSHPLREILNILHRLEQLC